MKNTLSPYNNTSRVKSQYSPLSNRGFTIVELLVVIVVVAILAAIAIVSYNGITRSAEETALKSNLRSAATKVTLHKAQSGSYPGGLDEVGVAEESEITQLQYTGGTNTYCVTAFSLRDPELSFYVDQGGEIREGRCNGHYGDSGPAALDMVSAGLHHTCGVNNGTVYCWGYNMYGQLGDGTTVSSDKPVAVDVSGVLSGKTVNKVSAGTYSTCVVADGLPYCWGRNNYGQLGDGTTVDYSSVPVAVDMSGVLSGKSVTDISVADGGGSYGDHVCVVADGLPYCWGRGGNGQLGFGTPLVSSSSTPRAVDMSGVLSGLTILKISTAGRHSCAVATNGKAYCWGHNEYGKLGNGTTVESPVPVAVTSSTIDSQTTDIALTDTNTCAMSNNRVYCWGLNNQGQAGRGSNTPPILGGSILHPVVELTSVTNLSPYCSIDSSIAYCWSLNHHGQLGNGDTGTGSTTPVAVDALSSPVTDISSGYNHVCAISGGRAYCWGSGSYGKLGNGSDETSNLPVPVYRLP